MRLAPDYPGDLGVKFAVRVHMLDGRALLLHSDYFTGFFRAYWSVWEGISKRVDNDNELRHGNEA